jgi:hypothetical protein
MLVDDFGNEFYETEIARRFSHMSQPIHQFGPSGISSVLIVKQGILNQGGPADIFLRMTKVPDDVVWEDCELDGDTTTTEQCLPEGYNPYAYENLVCENLDGTSGGLTCQVIRMIHVKAQSYPTHATLRDCASAI